MRILITGGCGFVGSNLCASLAQTGHAVVALDNLKRRGSELNVAWLKQQGVEFVHGDVRCPEDIHTVGHCDLLIECSAEPSVHAGYGDDPAYLVHTNLAGAANCLDYARTRRCGVLFLSTSRVYPIVPLRALPLAEDESRLALPAGWRAEGISSQGLRRDFPLTGNRSLYGATKLAAELLLEEYGAMYGVPYIINRCGVLAGPRQMGRVDQGFFSLWVARHFWKKSLAYKGFGGTGKQVRDVLHVDDFADLITCQIANFADYSGSVWNVGGGPENSLSLRELTEMCCRITGNRLEIGSVPETAPADIPWYVTDNGAVTERTGWRPRRGVNDLLGDVHAWLKQDAATLSPYFA